MRRRTLFPSGIVMVGVVFVASCSSSSETSGATAVSSTVAGTVASTVASTVAPTTSTSTDTTTTDLVTTTTEAHEMAQPGETLVGRWAHFDAVAYEDEVMKTLIISTGFADFEMRGDQLWNQMVFCHADVVNDQGIEIAISDAATSAIMPVATPVEVTMVDGLLRVIRPPTPTAIGIRLDDPANERLPMDPDDPRIFDADGDGNPGITTTLRIGEDLEGEIYLARREIFSYDVVQQSDERFVGTITDRSEQLIIGASDPMFLAPGQWEQIDDATRNPVIWQRVGLDWDCARLAAERDNLFPPNPTIDW